MSNYTKTTNFTAKDSLTSGDPSKKVLGSEHDTEYSAISTAIATKADSASPTFTGTVTVPSVTKTGTEVDSGTINYGSATETAAGTTYTAGLAITAYTTGGQYNIKFPTANTSATPTLNINSLGAKTIVKEGATPLIAGDIKANYETILRYNGTNLVLLNPLYSSGSIVQSIVASSSTMSTGTTVMPDDNTIPQNTEGDQYLTKTITPKSATNRLLIEVLVVGSHSVNGSWQGAIFQDATANALTAGSATGSGLGDGGRLYLVYEMAAGTTSATTFNVRAGGASAGTFTFNGRASGNWFGGVLFSFIKITEISA